MIVFRQPRHAYTGFRLDRTGLWPVVTLGWWTWDLLPGGIHTQVAAIVRRLRHGGAP